MTVLRDTLRTETTKASVRRCLCFRLSSFHYRLLADALPQHQVSTLAEPASIADRESDHHADLLVVGCPGNSDGRLTATVSELLTLPGNWLRVVLFDPATSCPVVLADVASRSRVSVIPTADHGFAITELQRLASARSASLTAERIRNDAQLAWPPELEVLGRRALALSVRPLTVAALARAARMPERTLRDWLARRSRLTPQRLIGWCRLLHVGDALDATDRTVEEITSALKFPSPAALRARLRLYTGLTPTDLRRAGALSTIAGAFGRALEEKPGGGDEADDVEFRSTLNTLAGKRFRDQRGQIALFIA